MKKGKAQAHPILRAFARTKKRLNAYTNRMFPEMKKRFDYDTAMGVYLDSFRKVPTLRAAVVCGLGDGSGLSGRVYLDRGYGRLVGYLAPEAQATQGKLEQMASPDKRIITVSELLEKTCQTSAYAPDQIKNLQNILEQGGYQITKIK